MKKLLFLFLFTFSFFAFAQEHRVRIFIPAYTHTYPENADTQLRGKTVTVPAINLNEVVPWNTTKYVYVGDTEVYIRRDANSWIISIHDLSLFGAAEGLIQILKYDHLTPFQVEKFKEWGGAPQNNFPAIGYVIYTIGDIEVEDEEDCGCTSCKNTPGADGQKMNSADQPGIDIPFGNNGFFRWFGQYFHTAASPNVTDPKFLLPIENAISEKIKDTNGNYHQIHNDQGLSQIDIVDPNSYTIKHYNPSDVGAKDANGNYTTTGNPHTTFTFSKTPAEPNTLIVTKQVGAVTEKIVKHAWDGSKWSMEQDFDADSNTDRKEYTTVTTSGSNTIKTSFIEDGSGNIASKIKRTYDANDNLLEENIDPDGVALITSYQYDANNNQTRVDYPSGAFDTTTYTANDLAELSTRFSGQFSKNVYDANDKLIKVIESFNGSTYTATESDHKVTTYDYTPVVTGDDGTIEADAVRTETVTILGNAISKTFYGYLDGETRTIIAATPTSAWNDAVNLTSYSFHHTAGDFIDQVYKTIEPGGTGSLIAYQKTGNTTTTTTESGVFDGAFANILEGSSTVEVVVDDLFLSSHTSDIATGNLISSRVITERDSQDREKRIDYHDGTHEMFIYGCCNLESTTARNGVITDYAYDSQGRQTEATSNGVTTKTTYDLLGNVLLVQQIGTDDTTRTISDNSYDGAGRLTSVKDAYANETTYTVSYNAGSTIETVTYPDLTTEITTTDSEGNVTNVTGTATFSFTASLDEERVENDATLGYDVLVQRFGTADNWTDSYQDALGRNYKSVTKSGAASYSYYNASGELTKTVDASGQVVLYQIEPENGIQIQAVDINKNDVIDYGTDTISRTDTEWIEENNIVWQKTQTWRNPVSYNAPGSADNINKVSNDGLARSNTSITNGISSTFEFYAVVGLNGELTVTSTSPDASYTETKTVNGIQEYEKRFDKNDVLLSTTIFGYDIFNRLNSSTDSRNGATTFVYDLKDRLLSQTTPDPDGAGPKTAQTFTNHYNNMGRRYKVTNSDSSEINFEYTTQGLIKKSHGANVYPREYVYDTDGQLEKVKTWRDYNNTTGENEIVWGYNALGQKVTETDKNGKVTTFTYNNDGSLATRTNPRGIVKTYTYVDGRVTDISYSDTTPAISFTYNSLGEIATVSDGAGSRTYNYNTLGQFTGFTWTAGAFSGITQTYNYDNIGRMSSVVANINGNQKTQSYEYDDSGRLNKVIRGSFTFIYSYLDQSPSTVETMTVEKNGTAQLHSKREFDKLMRTTRFTWKNGGAE